MVGPERWLAVPGYEGRYEVSDRGAVRSLLTWRGQRSRFIGWLTPSGYHMVRLAAESGASEKVMVHHLVLAAFVGERPPHLEVRHLDGCKTNNALDNLAYGTRSENQKDNVRLGVHPNTVKTACPQGHPFDALNTYLHPNGSRRCRACHRMSQRQYKKQRRAAA